MSADMTTAEYRELVAAEMDEETFTAQVLAEARQAGWRTLHIRPARTADGWRTPVQGDGRGFPDLLMLRGNQLIVAELKSGKPGMAAQKKLSNEQRTWADSWRAYFGDFVGVWPGGFAVWTPYDMDEIREVLA